MLPKSTKSSDSMTERTGGSSRGPNEERLQKLQAFERFTMSHPRLMQVKDRLISAIDGAAPGSLVLVIGPTGVGKTTLRLKGEQVLTAEKMPSLRNDPGRLPFVSIEAMASLTGSFNWRDHFTRMLLGMNEPMIADKLNGQRLGEPRGANGRFTPGPRAAGFELQYAVEQALCHRRPAAVFIDEAQHLGRITSGRKLSDQLDVIKSMANRTETVHVLFGTYELLAFRNLSGQLSRRCLDVHFARYSAESKEDLEIFKNVLLTFQNQLPIPACDLVKSVDESSRRQEETSVPVKRRRRAGQRSPKRDKVGVKVAVCG